MLKRGMALLLAGAVFTTASALGCSPTTRGGGGGTTTTSKTTTRGGGAGMATNEKKAGTLSSADRQFVEKAAAGDRTEIALANFALKHAQSNTTKQFAQRIVADHTKNLKVVTALADKLGVKLSTSAPAEVASTEKQFADKKGMNFDVAYLNMMVKEHTKDVAEFARQAKVASNPAVRAYAASTEPTLKTHLALAEQARKKV